MHLHSSCQVAHCHLRYLVLSDSLDTDVDMATQRHTISTYRLLFIRSHIIVNIWVPTLLLLSLNIKIHKRMIVELRIPFYSCLFSL